jgi:hypothetical protein
MISENVLLVKHLADKREDTVHIDYVRPYYSQDESPAIGQDASFPEEEDDQSKDIVYDTCILYEKPITDNVFEVETRVVLGQPCANKVADSGNLSDNRRMTRSRMRMLQEQASTDSSSMQQSTSSTKTTSTKPQSLLSRACASVKKIIPKRVSYSPSSRQQILSTDILARNSDEATSSSSQTTSATPSAISDSNMNSNAPSSVSNLTEISIIPVSLRTGTNKFTQSSRT